jgi:hypothetical protein
MWSNQTTNTSASGHFFYSVASDSTGTNLVAIVVNSGHIWVSSDSGVQWTDTGLGGHANQNWQWVTSNASGSQQVAVASNGDIWAN